MTGSRQVVAIMFTDISGYSALTQRNEALALELLEIHWKLLRPVFADFEGREIKTIGDAFLIEFPSALQAVRAGLAMQAALDQYNRTAAADRQIRIRIGIHLGDVERRAGDVFGDGVNIASRIEPLSPPGGICISESVYSSVYNKVDVHFHSMGRQRLKNINQPVVVYANQPVAHIHPAPARRTQMILASSVVALVVLAFALAVPWKERNVVPLAPAQSPASDATGSSAGSGSAVDDRQSIAVLPFANMSGDAATEPLTAGIHDDLITQISKIKSLKIISRTSVLQYRDTTKTIPEIAAELGVTSVLEGGVQRVGDRMRMNVQLIDAATDRHLWAETYDRQLTAADIFAAQSDIAVAIAEALRATLLPEEEKTLNAIPTRNFEAYQTYHLGKAQLALRTKQSMAEAEEYFLQAVKLDPQFALAFVGLADSYALQGSYGFGEREQQFAKAEAAAHKALALDERAGEAYATLGLLRIEQGDDEAAAAAFQRALELNPNYATAYHWYGSFLGSRNQYEEALKNYIKAAELDPRSYIIQINIVSALENLGRFDEAIGRLEKLVASDPDNARAYLDLGVLQGDAKGRWDRAFEYLQKGMVLDPDEWGFPFFLGVTYIVLGDPDHAETFFKQALALEPDLGRLGLAALHIARSETEELRAIGMQIEQTLLSRDRDYASSPVIYPQADLLSGRSDVIRAQYERRFPKLINDADPVVDQNNWEAAIDLALVLQHTGENERATMLLERSLTAIRGLPRSGRKGIQLADVEIYALQGKSREALAKLKEAIENGWRGPAWDLEDSLKLASIKGEPEFQKLVGVVRADLVRQIERVRMLEKASPVAPAAE